MGKRRLLTKVAKGGGSEIVWLSGPDKTKLADLIERAQKVWFRSKKLTEELEFWIKDDLRGLETDNKKRKIINLSNFSDGLKDFLGRDFKEIDAKAEKDREKAVKAPMLGVLLTTKDNKKVWVEAGVDYQLMALNAVKIGIQVGFFNSVAELPKKRAELALLLKKNRWPQLILRAGYASPAPHSPRRGVEEVLIN